MKFFDKLLNYKKFYSLYRLLPLILAATVFFLMLVWSIVDISVFKYGRYTVYHGVMQLESAFLCLIIWWLIGIVLAAATWFFSALAVSPTIIRTDAVIEMNERGKTN